MSRIREPTSYFEPEGTTLVPQPAAASPWSPEMLGGRQLAALVAWAVERDGEPGDAYQPARLTVDMFRPGPMRPLDVVTRVARAGHRIRVLDVSVRCDELEVCRGSAVLLRRGSPSPGAVWEPADWDVPRPDAVPTGDGPRAAFGDLRMVTPWSSGAEPGRMWLRETHQLVAGTPLSPLVRTALAADFANPMANSGDRGLGYINADLTLVLARPAQGEWVGCEVIGRSSDAGVAVGVISLHDLAGRIGYATVGALADGRLLRGEP